MGKILNLRLNFPVVGKSLFILAGALFANALVAILFNEPVKPFIISGLVAFSVGMLLYFLKNSEKEIVPIEVFPYNRMHAPSSTLTSNLMDIECWARAHLNAINAKCSGCILKPDTYKMVLKEQALIPNNGEHICLSWFKREQKNYTLYGHEGSDDGFRSSFWICPELDMYFLAVSNITNGAVKKVNKEILELMV